MAGGAERIVKLLLMAGAGGAESKLAAPIDITRRLVLEEPARHKTQRRVASAGQ